MRIHKILLYFGLQSDSENQIINVHISSICLNYELKIILVGIYFRFSIKFVEEKTSEHSRWIRLSLNSLCLLKSCGLCHIYCLCVEVGSAWQIISVSKVCLVVELDKHSNGRWMFLRVVLRCASLVLERRMRRVEMSRRKTSSKRFAKHSLPQWRSWNEWRSEEQTWNWELDTHNVEEVHESPSYSKASKDWVGENVINLFPRKHATREYIPNVIGWTSKWILI